MSRAHLNAVDPEKLRATRLTHTSRGLLDTTLPRVRQSILHPALHAPRSALHAPRSALRAYPAPQQRVRPRDSTTASLLRRSPHPRIFLYPRVHPAISAPLTRPSCPRPATPLPARSALPKTPLGNDFRSIPFIDALPTVRCSTPAPHLHAASPLTAWPRAT